MFVASPNIFLIQMESSGIFMKSCPLVLATLPINSFITKINKTDSLKIYAFKPVHSLKGGGQPDPFDYPLISSNQFKIP